MWAKLLHRNMAALRVLWETPQKPTIHPPPPQQRSSEVAARKYLRNVLNVLLVAATANCREKIFRNHAPSFLNTGIGLHLQNFRNFSQWISCRCTTTCLPYTCPSFLAVFPFSWPLFTAAHFLSLPSFPYPCLVTTFHLLEYQLLESFNYVFVSCSSWTPPPTQCQHIFHVPFSLCIVFWGWQGISAEMRFFAPNDGPWPKNQLLKVTLSDVSTLVKWI